MKPSAMDVEFNLLWEFDINVLNVQTLIYVRTVKVR